MRYTNFIFLALAFTLSACVTDNYYEITYRTKPEGASIVCGGQDKGYSPVELTYELSEEIKSEGILRTRLCEAVWHSGVTREFSNTTDLSEFPNGVIRTLPRPSEKGYQQDVAFETRLQQIRQYTDDSKGLSVSEQSYLDNGNDTLPFISNSNGAGAFIPVQPNLLYDTNSGSYTTSSDPHVAPHSDPHVLPHVVPHVAPHWEPHNLPHLTPHLH